MIMLPPSRSGLTSVFLAGGGLLLLLLSFLSSCGQTYGDSATYRQKFDRNQFEQTLKMRLPRDFASDVLSFIQGPKCNLDTVLVPIVPVIECIICGPNQTCNVTFGVRSCNPCYVEIPVNAVTNFITPLALNGYQPTIFNAGPYNSGAFTLVNVPQGSSVSWTLVTGGQSNSATVSNVTDSGPYCPQKPDSPPFPPSSLSLCTNPCNSQCTNLYVPPAPGQIQQALFYHPKCTCGCVPPDERVVLIVGGGCRNTSLVGATAKRLAQAGFKRVVVTSKRYPLCDPDILSLPNVYLYPRNVDVRSENEVQALFEDLRYGNPYYNVPELDRIDVVISGAGSPSAGLLFQTSGDKMQELLNNNEAAHQRVVNWFVKAWNATQSNGTHILVLGSIAGWLHSPQHTLYGVTKFGVRGMSIGFNLENRIIAINGTTKPYPHVTTVMPTIINTSFACREYFFSDCGSADPLVASIVKASCDGIKLIGVNASILAEGVYQTVISPADPMCLDDAYLYGDPTSPFESIFAIQPLNIAQMGSQRALREYNAILATQFTPPNSFINRKCPCNTF